MSIRLFKAGRPVDGAQVRVTLTMLDMAMGSLTSALPQTAPGRYERPAPVLGMSGRWQIALAITPRRGSRTMHLDVLAVVPESVVPSGSPWRLELPSHQLQGGDPDEVAR